MTDDQDCMARHVTTNFTTPAEFVSGKIMVNIQSEHTMGNSPVCAILKSELAVWTEHLLGHDCQQQTICCLKGCAASKKAFLDHHCRRFVVDVIRQMPLYSTERVEWLGLMQAEDDVPILKHKTMQP